MLSETFGRDLCALAIPPNPIRPALSDLKSQHTPMREDCCLILDAIEKIKRGGGMRRASGPLTERVDLGWGHAPPAERAKSIPLRKKTSKKVDRQGENYSGIIIGGYLY
jgi:hypothetical protein